MRVLFSHLVFGWVFDCLGSGKKLISETLRCEMLILGREIGWQCKQCHDLTLI